MFTEENTGSNLPAQIEVGWDEQAWPQVL